MWKLLLISLFLTSHCLFGKKKGLTKAEEFLNTYKDDFQWTIIASADGTHIAARAAFLQYKPELGFYIVAKSHTNKYEQLKANPYVTLSLNKAKDMNIPVFYATCRVSTDKGDIEKAWYKQLKDYGYSGKEDPQLVVFVFTIHSASLGNTKYEGVPYDYKSLNVVGDAPLPALPTGPYQDAEGLSIFIDAWRKDHNFHLFTYCGLSIHDRLMQLNYNNQTGFYFVTNAASGKVAQLSGNPNIALLQEQKSANVQVVVDGLLHEIKCNKLKEGTWIDAFKAYGYTGYDDPNYVVYKLVVRKVVVHSFTPESPKTYQFEPTAYDNATALLYTAWQANPNWSLATVDEHGNPHSRTMVLGYHSALGFWMGGNNASDKFKQLAQNNAAALNVYVPATGEDYRAQVSTRTLNCDAVRYAIKALKDKNGESQSCFADKKTLGEFLPFVLNLRSVEYKAGKENTTIIKICKTPATGVGADADAPAVVADAGAGAEAANGEGEGGTDAGAGEGDAVIDKKEL